MVSQVSHVSHVANIAGLAAASHRRSCRSRWLRSCRSRWSHWSRWLPRIAGLEHCRPKRRYVLFRGGLRRERRERKRLFLSRRERDDARRVRGTAAPTSPRLRVAIITLASAIKSFAGLAGLPGCLLAGPGGLAGPADIAGITSCGLAGLAHMISQVPIAILVNHVNINI